MPLTANRTVTIHPAKTCNVAITVNAARAQGRVSVANAHPANAQVTDARVGDAQSATTQGARTGGNSIRGRSSAARLHDRMAPPERSVIFCRRLLIRGVVSPEASKARKSDRCTATRLIDPSSSTSTTRHPPGPPRMT